MHQRTKQSGFTIVELMLAMGFVSILLMSIAVLTIQISNIYTKGITLREVNQAGLSVSNDLQRGIEESVPFDTTDSVVIQKVSAKTVGGRLCLGKYSYIWNYGDAINTSVNDTSKLVNHYVKADGSNDTSAPAIRLVKVVDADKSLCTPTNPGDTNPPVYPNITHDQTATELLVSGDRDLALHEVTISGTKIKPLYAISIVIGTNTDSEIAGGAEDTCKPPVELQGHQDYCSINRFDIIARAGNKQGSEPSQ